MGIGKRSAGWGKKGMHVIKSDKMGKNRETREKNGGGSNASSRGLERAVTAPTDRR